MRKFTSSEITEGLSSDISEKRMHFVYMSENKKQTILWERDKQISKENKRTLRNV